MTMVYDGKDENTTKVLVSFKSNKEGIVNDDETISVVSYSSSKECEK